MRKVIAAINMTINGNCDHRAGLADDQLHQHYTDLLNQSGVILYGRSTYLLMQYWQTLLENPSGQASMDDFAQSIDRIPKLVFSHTLQDTGWASAALADQAPADTVRKLKELPGKDILIGSRSLIMQLLHNQLIDEFQLCLHPLLEGMILGLTLAIMLGPAMFSLIQTSIHRGLYRGILLAGGIFLSDLALVVACYLGAVQVIGNDRNYLMFGIIGGVVLVIFGVVTFLRKVQVTDDNNLIDVKMPGPLTYILKGFFLNFANPFVWIFWVSVMVTVSSGYGADSWSIQTFFAGSLLTILSTDILKVIVAARLKRYLKPRILILINHIVGILLVLFGIYLVIRTFINF
mgnify:CR=1 FL=1